MLEFFAFLQNHVALAAVFVVLVLLIIWEEWRSKGGSKERINSKTLVNMINHKNAAIVDIRPADVFKKSHIINSINIPSASLENQLKKLNKYKNSPLVVIDNKGEAATGALDKLKKNEFTDVYFLAGGITTWQEDGLPLSEK